MGFKGTQPDRDMLDFMADNLWLMLAGTALLGVVLIFVGARAEAEAYRRLTGKEVSMWDALSLDLRIVEPIQGDK